MNLYKIDYVLDPRKALKFKGENSQTIVEWLFEQLIINGDFGYLIKLETKFNVLSIAVCSDKEIDHSQLEELIASLSQKADIGGVDFELNTITTAELLNNPALSAGDRERIEQLTDGNTQPVEATAESKSQPEEILSDKNIEKEEEPDIFETIRNLVAADELKNWANEMKAVADKNIDKDILMRSIMRMTYLVSVNTGNGSTTIFESMGKVVSKLMGKSSVSLKEYFVEPHPEAKKYNVEQIISDIGYVDPKGSTLYVFALHVECFQGGKNVSEWFKLLSGLHNSRGKAVIIFALPYLENLALNDMHDKIEDVIPNRVLAIRPMTNEDYVQCFKRYFEKCGMEIDEDVYPLVPQIIAKEKSDGRFYGINTMDKICDEISYGKIMSITTNPVSDINKITSEDVKPLLKTNDIDDGISGVEKLEAMVGLRGVKDTINEIVATVKMQRKMSTSQKTSMHMMFSGAPGTGKTVVARLLGQILRENNILSAGGFYEVSRKDLVGSYVGHTAPKTAEICKLAYGSVLFIDEAYLLDGGSENDFGKEAIGTLIAEMENKRDDMVVIFAGYEKELERLFSLNPGLRDRIPYRIQFPNYDRDELQQIFYRTLPGDFSYDEEFESTVSEFFRTLSDDVMMNPDFSNGRFVRNLVERICSKAALRMQMEPVENEKQALAVTAADFKASVADGEFKSLNQPKKKEKTIGFSVQ